LSETLQERRARLLARKEELETEVLEEEVRALERRSMGLPPVQREVSVAELIDRHIAETAIPEEERARIVERERVGPNGETIVEFEFVDPRGEEHVAAVHDHLRTQFRAQIEWEDQQAAAAAKAAGLPAPPPNPFLHAFRDPEPAGEVDDEFVHGDLPDEGLDPVAAALRSAVRLSEEGLKSIEVEKAHAFALGDIGRVLDLELMERGANR
jgi:hypothetical protein